MVLVVRGDMLLERRIGRVPGRRALRIVLVKPIAGPFLRVLYRSHVLILGDDPNGMFRGSPGVDCDLVGEYVRIRPHRGHRVLLGDLEIVVHFAERHLECSHRYSVSLRFLLLLYG